VVSKLPNHPTPWLQMGVHGVNPIPSMICEDESLYLHWLAREVYQGHGEIVDAGPLLGGSTVSLASGLANNDRVPDKKRIHSYDLFEYFPDFKERLLPRSTLKQGDSLLPLFLENTSMYREIIEIHSGDITKERWEGGPIELLFIDCDKDWDIHNHINREFFRALIPGAIVVQQDYFHYGCPWIHLQMEFLKEYFEIAHGPASGGTVGFKVVRPIPPERLAVDLRQLSVGETTRLMDAAGRSYEGFWPLFVRLAHAHLLAGRSCFAAASGIVSEVTASPHMDRVLEWDVQQVENELAAQGIYPQALARRIPAYYRNGGLVFTLSALVRSLSRRTGWFSPYAAS